MKQNFKREMRIAGACLAAGAWQLIAATAAVAQQAPPPSPPAAAQPAPAPTPAAPGAAPAATPAAPTSNAMATPALSGPLVANPDPMHLDVAPFFGPMYVTGAVSGLALAQTQPVGLDHTFVPDISNMQAALQTTTGMFQFFLEPGVYSFPTVGAQYKGLLNMSNAVDNTFGGLPVAWGKVVFSDNFNIQGGKLPTLIGYEAPFTFQNMNVERGLLWAQEPIVSRGAQANLTTGPVAWSLSFNDGYYSGQYNWLSGAATWTINPQNSIVVTGGGALDRNTAPGNLATPVPQNNGSLIEASYTYSNAPWTITPYIQYTHVSSDAGLGLVDSSTIGGALLASYAFTDHVSMAGRWEYIGSNGAGFVGGAGLLGYGPGSSAMSFTLTPTFQNGIYFLRGEASLTELYGITKGFGFGNGGGTTQARFLVESGVVF